MVVFIILAAFLVASAAIMIYFLSLVTKNTCKHKPYKFTVDLETELLKRGYTYIDRNIPMMSDLKGYPAVFMYTKNVDWKYGIMFGTNGRYAVSPDDVIVEIKYFGYGSEDFCTKDIQSKDPVYVIQVIEDHARKEYENRKRNQKIRLA